MRSVTGATKRTDSMDDIVELAQGMFGDCEGSGVTHSPDPSFLPIAS